MTDDRATDVNTRLCEAFFVLHGIKNGPVPNMDDVSVEEAQEAAAIVTARPPVRNETGYTFDAAVAQYAIPRVIAFAHRQATMQAIRALASVERG